MKDSVVRARISTETKNRAVAALDRIGLSVSDLIRLTLVRVADEGRLPFELSVPNRTTREAMAELAEGKGVRSKDGASLLKDLRV